MKKFVALLTGLLTLSLVSSSQGTLPPLDKSPMDMSYYPANYPVLKIQDKAAEPLAARVIYSRPKKGGRPVFGGLVEYGKLWRLGANEATEIEFYKPVTIGNKKIAKGRYTLYAIVNEKSWTFIINKDTDIWGSFKYDSSKDLVRTDVPVQHVPSPAESLTMVFEKSVAGCNLVIFWETIKVALPINF